MKQGFALIEVLIAAAISTMIGAALFTSLYQITRFTTIVDNYADVWTKASIVHRQMEKDLLGTFIPVAAEKAPEKKKEDAGTASDKKDIEKKESEPSAQKKEPVKVVTHVFYGTSKDTMLDMLTFITDNPMQVYWGPKAGKAKPRVARVVYRLIPDKDVKNSYTLMRQEGYDLYFDAYKEGGSKEMRAYPMIEGIKQMSIYYGVEEKDTQESKDTEKKPKKITYKTVKEWKKEDDQKKQEGKESKKKELELPAFVLIKLTLWDQQKKRMIDFEFKIPLIAQGKSAPAVVDQPAMPPPLPAQKPGQAAVPGAQNPAPLIPGLPMNFGMVTHIDTGRVEYVGMNNQKDQLQMIMSGSSYAQ